MNGTRLQAVMFLALVATTGCFVRIETGNYSERRGLAEGSTTLFHQRLSEERYGDVLELIHPDVIASQSEGTVSYQLRTRRLDAGSFVSSELQVATCFPTEVRLIYYSRYSSGDTTEFLVWGFKSGKPGLVSWQLWKGHS